MTTTNVLVPAPEGTVVDAYIRPHRARVTSGGAEVANVSATAASTGYATLALRHTSEITPAINHWLIIVRTIPIVTYTLHVTASTVAPSRGVFKLKLQDANSYIIGNTIEDVVYRGEANVQ